MTLKRRVKAEDSPLGPREDLNKVDTDRAAMILAYNRHT
jgi:hypothetical protein